MPQAHDEAQRYQRSPVRWWLHHGWCRGWATAMLARDAKIAGEL